jgi:ornithine carbamoyltransferase
MTKRQHFLRIADFSADELRATLDRAADLKARQKRGEVVHTLRGKTLAMIFEKASTRTRVSFEVGMVQLGGHALFLSGRDLQIGRGEPPRDTARVLARYCDGVMIRTFAQETVEEIARWSSVPVINGLTDTHHPCQLMADLLTARERGLDLGTMVVAWIGDGNNMANSWIEAAERLGFELRLACPATHRPNAEILARAQAARPGRITLTSEPSEAARGAALLNTDVWASMGQEGEAEARKVAFAGYTIDAALLSKAAPGAVVLHCLPAHRGEEITDDVIEGTASAVWDQAENRLHAQKAVLERLMAG